MSVVCTKQRLWYVEITTGCDMLRQQSEISSGGSLTSGILASGILSHRILSGELCPAAFCPVAFCPGLAINIHVALLEQSGCRSDVLNDAQT